jgi:hypothetical protein
MTKTGLTKEEKQCLQRWFRQAIAEVEKEEAKHFLLREFPPETGSANHRLPLVRRRSHRGQRPAHAKELVY